MIINLPNHVLASQSHAAHNQADGVLQHYRLMPLLWLRAMGETVREIAVPRSSCFVWGPRRRCRRGSSCWRPGASATPASTSGPSHASPWGTPSVTSASCCCWACGDRIPGWPFGPSPTGASTRCRSTRTSRRRSTRTSSDWWATGPLWSCSSAGRHHHWDIWGDECASTISLARWGYRVPSDRQWPQAALAPADDEATTDAMDAAGEEGTS